MVKVGQKVRFDPYHNCHYCGSEMAKCEVVGEVILVHHKHRYFMAEYEAGDKKFKISFKFDDFNGPDKFVYIVEE